MNSGNSNEMNLFRVFVLTIVVMLGGCQQSVKPGDNASATKTASAMTDDRLIQRHEERWAAVISVDFDKVYEYATPEYRALYSKTHLHNQYAAQIRRKAAHVANIRRDESDPTVAYVKTELTFQTLLPDGGNIYQDQILLDETWKFSDGEWWFVEPR